MARIEALVARWPRITAVRASEELCKEGYGGGYLEFLERLLGEQADLRHQRAVERRIRDARFHELKTLTAFDWKFNARAIDRSQIEGLATGEFVRRGDNLVLVGQSGVGKKSSDPRHRPSCLFARIPRAICDERRLARRSGGFVGRPQPAATAPLLEQLRAADRRRIRLR